MNVITMKDASVTFDPVTPAHVHMLSALERTALACQVSLEVTCGREDHPPSDVHTLGQAIDVSVRDLAAPMIVRVRGQLMVTLGGLWTVLFETPTPIDSTLEPQLVPIATVNSGATARHLHIQPVKGTTWPPPGA